MALSIGEARARNCADALLYTRINQSGYSPLMSRLSRIIVPDIRHHVTPLGNRRQKVFLHEDDYALYRDLLAQRYIANSVAVWSYCLMPNHIHLILVPSDDKGLSRTLAKPAGVTAATSTPVFGLLTTCSKAVLARWRWTKRVA